MPDEDRHRQPEQPTPTVRDLAMVLFRQRWTFVCAFGLVLGASVLYVFTGARYQAHMKVLVRPGRADAPVSAQQNAPIDLTRVSVTEEALNSEAELLRDDDVLRKVVEENRLGGRDWLHFLRLNEGPAERVERAARRLGKALKVTPLKRTNLIAITYSSRDPRQAAQVLESVANAYLQKHTAVRRPGGELRFFEEQTQESRRQLEEAQQKLLQFSAARGVVAAAQERDLALQKFSDVDARARQGRVELAETQQRVHALEAQLATLPERTTTQVRTADNPELMKALKSSLVDLQLKRTQLLTKFEPNHRLVREMEEEIAQVQAAIEAENLSPVRDETTDKDPHYEWAKSELQKARVQLKAVEARNAATDLQESAYRGMTRQLGDDSVVQEDLLNRLKAAEESYLLYAKKREEARMSDALDQGGIVNVAIAEQPVAPALPVWSTWMLLAVGLIAAGTAGSATAFVADYLDPALRTPEDVVACLNAPVLASLPRRSVAELSWEKAS